MVGSGAKDNFCSVVCSCECACVIMHMSLAVGQDKHPKPQLKHQQPLTWCV